jgi:hypothetical protein
MHTHPPMHRTLQPCHKQSRKKYMHKLHLRNDKSNLSTYPSINESSHPPTQPAVHPSIPRSIHLASPLSIYPSILLSIHLAIHPSVCPSIPASNLLSVCSLVNSLSPTSFIKSKWIGVLCQFSCLQCTTIATGCSALWGEK